MGGRCAGAGALGAGFLGQAGRADRSGRTAGLPWPPQIVTLTQEWPRRSSPLFLHVTDWVHEAQISLHFYQGVIGPADQDSFTATFFQVFAETVPD